MDLRNEAGSGKIGKQDQTGGVSSSAGVWRSPSRCRLVPLSAGSVFPSFGLFFGSLFFRRWQNWPLFQLCPRLAQFMWEYWSSASLVLWSVLYSRLCLVLSPDPLAARSHYSCCPGQELLGSYFMGFLHEHGTRCLCALECGCWCRYRVPLMWVSVCALEPVSPQGVAARCPWQCAVWSLDAGVAAECCCRVLLPPDVNGRVGFEALMLVLLQGDGAGCCCQILALVLVPGAPHRYILLFGVVGVICF